MTLNLTIINSFGVWQGSDHRLTDPNTGKIVYDYSVKHLLFECPDGCALLTYAGVGRVRDIDLSDWLRETLRGETRTLDQSLVLIRENSSRDLGKLLHENRVPHMYTIGAFLTGKPWCFQIQNFHTKDRAKDSVPEKTTIDHFITVAKPIGKQGLSLIFGDDRLLRRKDRQLLQTAANKKPREPKEFCNLLAAIIRRSALNKQGISTVSPNSIVTYMPPEGKPFKSEGYGTNNSPTPLVAPFIKLGIDLTDFEKGLLSFGNPANSNTTETAKLIDNMFSNFVNSKNRLRK